MRVMVMAAVLALAAACAPAEEREQMSAGCDARATAQWQGGDATFNIEASSAGPDCARAVATLVIRDASGAPLYAQSYPASQIMVLAPAQDTAAMQTALQDWAAYDNHTMATTSALPEWPRDAAAPANGEFPFYPDEGYNDRTAYAALRQANAPLFCYVQGMESMACLALRDGMLERIGVQSFPG